jgi:acyl carrier protein
VDSKDAEPTFNDVAEFVRDWARLPAKKQITPDTQFERDLGITGDDGDELLQAAQKRFKVNFTDGDNGVRTIFKLGPNEYLFNSEGFPSPFGGGGIITLFSTPDTNFTVRAFTIGELCVAIQKAPPSDS